MSEQIQSRDVANRGIIRPPVVYLVAIAAGLLLHFAWPLRFLARAVGVPLGIVILFVAVALFTSAVRAFRFANTPVPGNRATTKIVKTGPYRWTRNPIYLAFSLVQLGVAFLVSSVWLLVTLVAALAVALRQRLQ